MSIAFDRNTGLVSAATPPEQDEARSAVRGRFDLPAGADSRPRHLWRTRWQAVHRAAGRRRDDLVRHRFGAPITAPVAVADGRIYVACEDGYLYVFGPDGNAPLPDKGSARCGRFAVR